MKKLTIMTLLWCSLLLTANASEATDLQERNKKIARDFYQDLWFSNNTDNYQKYVAEQYEVWDIGERKGVTEPAITQKHIADMFWQNGKLSGKIDYQIAEGDWVATRWVSHYEPSTLKGKLFKTDSSGLPIINVLKFNEDGKIIEFWNHRHDIDTRQTLRFTITGLLIGLFIALIPTIIAIRQRKKIRKLASQ
ncbi:ester cyclase [Thalassotalea litorea]|uniref:Ester cyclase n=1 Tax=Thalassotalea litorea TaxID=2020715 RepID=A0A5R9ILI1_9GAMM|nr:ester cyclase [Thalassotalea litorea]TLU65323.1 ester cyclase [Thalassotalea litorea]